MKRRDFLKTAGSAAALATAGCSLATSPDLLQIAMLHLEPQLGEMDENCNVYESAMTAAANAGAKWILTPELGLTGYRFDLKIGTDWIKPGPDPWVERLGEVAHRLGVTLFLGHLELDPADGNRYNTVFVFGRDGKIAGRHRKINTIPVSEGWSTPASGAAPVTIDNRAVGILVCADAWPPDHAQSLARQNAEILISTATWPPEPHGPEKCWEQRTLDTGLPLMVCNRTGVEPDFDIRQAESVVVDRGQRLVRHQSEYASILLVDWNQRTRSVERQSVIHIDPATGRFRA